MGEIDAVSSSKIYELAGIRVSISADSPAVQKVACQVLQEKGFRRSAGAAHLRFELGAAAQDSAESGELLTPPTSLMAIRRDGGRYQLEHRSAGLLVIPERGEAIAYRLPIPPDSTEQLVDVVATISMALFLLLRPLGFIGIHAVGLVANGTGFLFSGASDSGKSTTALALVRRGWGYLSDDSLLLRSTDAGVIAIGLRRDFCVDASAAGFFPELASRTWPRQATDPEKWRVNIEALYPGEAMSTCRPSVLLFPRVEECAESSVEPISPSAAFDLLAKQTAFVITARDPLAGAHFEVLTALLRQCTARVLVLGRDVIDDPARLDLMLRSLATASPSAP